MPFPSYPVVDDSFTRADTSVGGAGSTTGAGRSWIDVKGSVYNIATNTLKGQPEGTTTTGYLRDFLARPVGESALDSRMVIRRAAGADYSCNIGACLRWNGTSVTPTYYLGHITSTAGGQVYVYKVVAGVVTAIINAAAFTVAYDNTHVYEVDFAAVGSSPTTFTITVRDLTLGTIVYTNNSNTDSTAGLQVSGQQAVVVWDSAGTNFGNATRVKTFVAPTVAYNAVFKGDSLTYGTNASSGAGTVGGTVYPATTLAYLGPTWQGNNKGVSGQTLATALTNINADLDALYDGSKTNVLFLMMGTNDLGVDSQTAAQTYTRLSSYCAAAKAKGWSIVLATIPPAANAAYPTNFDTLRASYNSLILSGYRNIADVLVNTSIDINIGRGGAEDNADYFNASDRTHFTDVGYAILGEYMAAGGAMLGLIPSLSSGVLISGGW